MSTTAHWEAVRPEEPLGSSDLIKYVLFDDGSRLIGQEAVVESDSTMATYLRGYRDALPAADHRREALAEFLGHLDEHKQLRVWIAE